ncbi:MAG: cyclohydrolase FolE2 [Firmicutes bacterium]|nr:cyclohydrolase FolE2 [Bacillota bacterium]
MNKMIDVQKQKDTREVPLKKVGIKDLKWPIKVMDKEQGFQHTVGKLTLSVDLPSEQRGTHMSRFVEIANSMDSLNPKYLEELLVRMKERLGGMVAHFKVEFDYFIRKESPVTGIIAPTDIACAFEAELGEEFKFLMRVDVPVSTLCPCSKEISQFGAHNQRAIVSMVVSMNKLVWIEDLVKVAEESGSCPVYSLLKREDEKYVTETAYLNPRFVEDAAREVAIRLDNLDGIDWYSVDVESIESIHNHNAFAHTEKAYGK